MRKEEMAWWEIGQNLARTGLYTVLYTLATFHNQPNSSQYQQRYYLHHSQTYITALATIWSPTKLQSPKSLTFNLLLSI